MPIKLKLTKDENGNIKDIVLNPETITIEKEVWESTFRASMERAAEIEKLKKQLRLAEEAIDRAYQRCENCNNGVCQYCHLSCVVSYYRRKEKL